MAEKPGEAVCFTSGPQGATFGAGVIHAWLACDRTAPSVVAGISTGSITAAAMQRSMSERGEPDADTTEAQRWTWFQGYLADTLDRPLDVIWKSIPDPVDFFSATMPVRDISCPDELKDDEREARYHFWTVTKVGNWLSHLPVSIGEVATLAILRVRLKEQIPIPVIGNGFVAKIWRSSTFWVQAISISVQILHRLIWAPSFMRTSARFTYEDKRASGIPADPLPFWKPGLRPLFGWRAWFTGWGVAGLFGIIVLLLPAAIWGGLPGGHRAYLIADAVLVSVTAIFAAITFKTKPLHKKLKDLAARIGDKGSFAAEDRNSFADRLTASIMKNAGIDRSIISNYQLKRRIHDRFHQPERVDSLRVKSVDPDGTSLVIVAAVLQKLKLNQQCWARCGSLVDALTTACAVEQLFPATHLTHEQSKKWLRRKDLEFFGNSNQQVDLIDGGIIRRNPLPALFNWLQENTSVANSLVSESVEDARVHVIYTLPIEPFDAYEGKKQPAQIDLIESAQVGILMRIRRDTSVEVRQTNYLSTIVNAQIAAGGKSSKLPIFADQIAPARELRFKNDFSPTRQEGLKATAEGCRRTLGRLFAAKLEAKTCSEDSVVCKDFLKEVAPFRAEHLDHCSGLPEVCAACTGRLSPYREPKIIPDIVQADFGKARDTPLSKEFGNLVQIELPRIAFVASGGVFRGAFHIGLIGALQALRATPDLVVGASVGTLMGGALAAIRNTSDPREQLRLLGELCDTFLRVDEKVALTVPLKTAVKRLGLRARKLALSPDALRAIVKAGTATDAGYAATGVPPLVIDALSQLFIIPPTETIKVGSFFLAGRFAAAASSLLKLIRTNTLDSLEIRCAVIGTSLLKNVARVLLSGRAGEFDLNQRQPYLRQTAGGTVGTAVFCTTAWVNQRWLLVLGRDSLVPQAPAFNFLNAALCSSAFPAAFPARPEAEVFPGSGSVTNFFCDGGTFDNLPFIPTVDLLRATQMEGFKASGLTPLEFLERRLKAPDLILSGGFDPQPENDLRQRFESQTDVAARASALGSSVKTESFIVMSNRVTEHLQELAVSVRRKLSDPAFHLPAQTAKVMTGSVIAEIVNIVPTSELHVNPTFGFSRSLGFDKDRVAASIADGCFQTLLNLRQEKWEEMPAVQTSLALLGIHVQLRGTDNAKDGACPWFKLDCLCPFFEAGNASVYDTCRKDAVHKRLIRINLP